MNDLQARKKQLEDMLTSYIYFVQEHMPSGDLMSKINQFCDIYAEAEPNKMYLYQRMSNGVDWGDPDGDITVKDGVVYEK